jgi:hypothetical protein
MKNKYGEFEMVNGAIANELIEKCQSRDEKINGLRTALENIAYHCTGKSWRDLAADIRYIAQKALEEYEHLTLEIFYRDNAIVRRDAEIIKLSNAIIRYTGLVEEYDLDDDGELLLEMETFIKNEIKGGEYER